MSKERTLKFLSFWIPPMLWAAMIFKFSSGQIPMASSSFWLDFVVKKIGHFILFAVLAVLFYRGLIGEGLERKRAAVLAAFFAFLYGVSDEIHQTFTQGREAKIRDVIIDGFGASFLMFSVYKYLNRLPGRLREILADIGIK